MSTPAEIAVLGMGAMGRTVLSALRTRLTEAGFSFYERPGRVGPLSQELGLPGYDDVGELLGTQRRPDLVVECAGHRAVAELVPEVLEAGVDVVLVSLGSLSDDALRTRLMSAAERSGASVRLVSGAMGGLDALRSAVLAGVDSVVYEGRKPPEAWKGSPAEEACTLDELTAAAVFFSGTARQASEQYPKNANVTAAVALAGLGFDETEVRLIADPDAEQNSHTLYVQGRAGGFSITLWNNPLPQNPKTSWLAALSAEEAVLNQTLPLRF